MINTRSGTGHSPAMLTDHYEFTQLEAALRDGTAGQPAVFELFTRSMRPGRGYGVLAGLGRFLDALEEFTFSEAELDFLYAGGVIGEAARSYLSGWRFTGTISGYREGDLFFAHSPVLTVESTFGDGLLLETLALSIFNHDSAVASAAARMHTAARGRPMIEMGSRRTHEVAAIAAARAAYIVGFGATSNLAAGYLYGVPTAGTSAHAFTLAHDSEVEAFSSQIAALGIETTLLVDTYDTRVGISNAVEAARRIGATGPGAIRIDSGELATEARLAREQLDELGAHQTKIVLSGDLDEYSIDDLANQPVDAFGVGTSVVTGSEHPTVGFVYKLVAVTSAGAEHVHPVAKRSAGKATLGGLKQAWRTYDNTGVIAGESIAQVDALDFDAVGALQVPVFVDGVRVHRAGLDEVRAHHISAKRGLSLLDLALVVETARVEACEAPNRLSVP